MVQFMKVISVKALPDYMLLLEFEDGAKKKFDFKKLLNSAPFYPLKNVELFNKAKSDNGGGGVVWDDDIDIASEYLYDNGILVR